MYYYNILPIYFDLKIVYLLALFAFIEKMNRNDNYYLYDGNKNESKGFTVANELRPEKDSHTKEIKG